MLGRFIPSSLISSLIGNPCGGSLMRRRPEHPAPHPSLFHQDDTTPRRQCVEGIAHLSATLNHKADEIDCIVSGLIANIPLSPYRHTIGEIVMVLQTLATALREPTATAARIVPHSLKLIDIFSSFRPDLLADVQERMIDLTHLLQSRRDLMEELDFELCDLDSNYSSFRTEILPTVFRSGVRGAELGRTFGGRTGQAIGYLGSAAAVMASLTTEGPLASVSLPPWVAPVAVSAVLNTGVMAGIRDYSGRAGSVAGGVGGSVVGLVGFLMRHAALNVVAPLLFERRERQEALDQARRAATDASALAPLSQHVSLAIGEPENIRHANGVPVASAPRPRNL